MERKVLVITDASPASGIIADSRNEPVGDRFAEHQGSRSSEDVGGGFGKPSEAPSLFKTVSLSANGLKDQIANLLEVVQYVFDQPFSRAAVTLEEVALSVEISSEGEIRILGSGGKLGGRGAINMVFKRKPPGPAAPVGLEAKGPTEPVGS